VGAEMVPWAACSARKTSTEDGRPGTWSRRRSGFLWASVLRRTRSSSRFSQRACTRKCAESRGHKDCVGSDSARSIRVPWEIYRAGWPKPAALSRTEVGATSSFQWKKNGRTRERKNKRRRVPATFLTREEGLGYLSRAARCTTSRGSGLGPRDRPEDPRRPPRDARRALLGAGMQFFARRLRHDRGWFRR